MIRPQGALQTHLSSLVTAPTGRSPPAMCPPAGRAAHLALATCHCAPIRCPSAFLSAKRFSCFSMQPSLPHSQPSKSAQRHSGYSCRFPPSASLPWPSHNDPPAGQPAQGSGEGAEGDGPEAFAEAECLVSRMEDNAGEGNAGRVRGEPLEMWLPARPFATT